MIDPTPLSPAAQAVLDASLLMDSALSRSMVAATLRAAANQVWTVQWNGRITPDASHGLGINWSRDALHAIAADLEGTDG